MAINISTLSTGTEGRHKRNLYYKCPCYKNPSHPKTHWAKNAVCERGKATGTSYKKKCI
jgi:hypothetical protein